MPEMTTAYDKPVTFREWIQHHNLKYLDTNLIYKNTVEGFHKLVFKILPLFKVDYKQFDQVLSMTGFTVSKSVEHPIFKLDLSAIGLEVEFYTNLYYWNISVKSKHMLDPGGFRALGTRFRIPTQCDKLSKRMEIEVNDDFDLYTFFVLLAYQIGIEPCEGDNSLYWKGVEIKPKW